MESDHRRHAGTRRRGRSRGQSLRRFQRQSGRDRRGARFVGSSRRTRSPHSPRAEPSTAERGGRADDQSISRRPTDRGGDEAGFVTEQLPIQAQGKAGDGKRDRRSARREHRRVGAEGGLGSIQANRTKVVTAEWIAKTDEDFYPGLGFKPLPGGFWVKSDL